MRRPGIAALALLALLAVSQAVADPGQCSNPDSSSGAAKKPCGGSSAPPLVAAPVRAVASAKDLKSALKDAKLALLLIHKGDA